MWLLQLRRAAFSLACHTQLAILNSTQSPTLSPESERLVFSFVILEVVLPLMSVGDMKNRFEAHCRG